MMRLLQYRVVRARDGVGAIEFAVIAGLLSIVLLGIVDFGLGFWEKMQVGNAARAGADYARKNGFNATNIATAVVNATNLPGVQATPAPTQACGCPDATTGVTPQTCGQSCPGGDIPGTFVTVNAQVSYSPLFSWPGLGHQLTLASTVTVRMN